MTVETRPYDPAHDYEPVSRFFIDVYEPSDRLLNWMQPRWEYMHFHTMSIGLPFDRCGVSEDETGINLEVRYDQSADLALQIDTIPIPETNGAGEPVGLHVFAGDAQLAVAANGADHPELAEILEDYASTLDAAEQPADAATARERAALIREQHGLPAP